VQGFWESFRLDPRQPEYASMRASDADRDTVRAVLADAFADGRLTSEECNERLNTLYSSRTLGEFPPLVADLVGPDGSLAGSARLPAADLRASGARKWRKEVEESFTAFLVPTVICTVIWLVATRGFFWPAIPMLFLGLNLLKTVVQRESAIEREVLRLEKPAGKEEKQSDKDGA
jgi:hypothetical protein